MDASSPRTATSPRPPRATPSDRLVGARVRQRRLVLGLTQQQLADRIEVGYQQTYDYEAGAEHIAADRLSRIAAVLGVEVAYFAEPPIPAA